MSVSNQYWSSNEHLQESKQTNYMNNDLKPDADICNSKSLDISLVQLSTQAIHSQSNNETNSIKYFQKDQSTSQFDLQQYIEQQTELDEDFINYVNKQQLHEEQKCIKTQETQYEQNKQSSQLLGEFGNHTDRIDVQFMNSKGFKANKQPIMIKNMKKWRLKQQQKQIKTFDQYQLQQSQQINTSSPYSPQNSSYAQSQQQSPNQRSYSQKMLIQPLENKQSINGQEFDLSQYAHKVEVFQKNIDLLSEKAISLQKEKVFTSIPVEETVHESHELKNEKESIYLFGAPHKQNFPHKLTQIQEYNKEFNQKSEKISQNILIKRYSQGDQFDSLNKQLSSSKLLSSNPFQLIKKNSLNEKSMNQCNKQLFSSQNKQCISNQNQQQKNTCYQQQQLTPLQIDNDSSTKFIRSQSLNNRFIKQKNSTSGVAVSPKNILLNTATTPQQQDYFLNYFNTADTNHLLLSNITKGIVQPPPQAVYPDPMFIPKVQTRNASFLKRGSNPSDSFLFTHNTSLNTVKQKESRTRNSSISYNQNNQNDNPSKIQLPKNIKSSAHVLQFNPFQSTTPKSSQMLSSQGISFSNNIKSYLFYQNKFLGQKQHEFLLNNFKQASKLTSQSQVNSLNWKDQASLTREVSTSIQNNKQNQIKQQQQQQITQQQNHHAVSQFQQHHIPSEKSIGNKQQEDVQKVQPDFNQYRNVVSPKRVQICSFTNQQKQKYKQIECNEQDTIEESENTSSLKNGFQHITQDSAKLDFDDLQKYYDEKYEQKISNQQKELFHIKKNTKQNKKLKNILNGQNRASLQFQKDLKLQQIENEEIKQNEKVQSSNHDEEEYDELDQLKPWNINTN